MPKNAFEILLHMKMLDEGIVPYGVVPPGLLQQLEDMTPAQRKKMKRKFRKLWRKAYKKSGTEPYELSAGKISRHEKSRRAALVFHQLKCVVQSELNSTQD